MHFYDHNLVQNDPEKEIKSFVVVPQCKWKRQHIRIDARQLAAMALEFEKEPNWIKTLQEIRGDPKFAQTTSDGKCPKLTDEMKKQVFDRYFDVKRMNRGGRGEFDYSLTTDGVSCHIQKVRYVRVADNDDDDEVHRRNEETTNIRRPRIYSQPTATMRQKKYNYIIGFDPGYKVPVATVRQNTQTNEEDRFTLTWREFRKRCGDKERKARLHKINHRFEKEMQRIRQDKDQYAEEPSPKSPNFREYIQYQLRAFNRSFEVSKQFYNNLFR